MRNAVVADAVLVDADRISYSPYYCYDDAAACDSTGGERRQPL